MWLLLQGMRLQRRPWLCLLWLLLRLRLRLRLRLLWLLRLLWVLHCRICSRACCRRCYAMDRLPQSLDAGGQQRCWAKGCHMLMNGCSAGQMGVGRPAGRGYVSHLKGWKAGAM